MLLGLLCLAVLALLAPVTADFYWSGEKGFLLRLRVAGIGFKLLPRSPAPQDPAKEKARAEKQKRAEEKQAKKQKKSSPKTARRQATPAKAFTLTAETLKSLAATAGGAVRRALAGLRVHHIRVYLPVHGEDAASTALSVGRIHAALGASFGVLNNFLRLEFEQLTIEPDYTGENEGKAFFSCKITTHLLIMLVVGVWALVRLKQENIF